MKKGTKRLITLFFLCVFFVIGYYGSTFMTRAGEDDSSSEDGSSLVDSMSLKLKDGTGEIVNATIVYKNDILDVRYNLKELIPGTNIEQGKVYAISLPTNFLIASSNEWEAEIGGLKIAHCKYNGAGKIFVTFHDDLFTGTANINDAYIGFFATVDGTGKNAGDLIQVDPPTGATGGRPLTYGGDEKPVSVKVDKEILSYNETTKEIEWKVTVTEGPEGYSSLVIKDTFSAGQAYVTGSFRVDGNSVSDPMITNNSFEYTIDTTSPMPNKKHEITYKTVVYPVKVNKTGGVTSYDLTNSNVSVTAKNDVSVYADSSGTPLDTASADRNFEFGYLTWDEKACEKIEVAPDYPDDRIVTWKVTVRAYDYTFKNVVIRDEIDTGNVSANNFEFVGDFKMVKKENDGSDTDMQVSVDRSPAFDASGVCEWNTDIIPTLDPGTYEITYKIRIKDYMNYKLANTDSKKIVNTAWAEYDEIAIGNLPGMGPGVFPKITVDAGDIATSAAGLYKGTYTPGYNDDYLQRGAEVHGLPWEIKVNTDRDILTGDYYLIETIGGSYEDEKKLPQVIKSAKVEDVIFDVKVDGRPATEDQKAAIEILTNANDTSLSEHEVKITFGDLLAQGHEVSFRFQTYIAESEKDFYEGHNQTDELSRNAYNTVTLYNGIDPILTKDACYPVYTKVLDKSFEKYDYATREAVWKMQVNRDMMQLDGARLKDTLTGELSKVEVVKYYQHSYAQSGTVTLTTSADDDSDGLYYTYDADTREVVVYFGTGIEMGYTYDVIIYEKLDPKTEIDDNGTKKTLEAYNGKINITNTAVLEKDGSSPVTAKATGIIDNMVFDKNAAIVATGKATYTIHMNQARARWTTGAEISDIMSEGLMPDVRSFVLKEASVESDGTFTAGATVDAGKYDVSVTILEAGNTEGVPAGSVKTVVTLPDDAADKAYILTYDVYVDEAYVGKTGIDFTNTVTIEGDPNDGDIASKTLSLSNLLGYGGGTLEYSKVKLVKKNEETTVLKGAEFDLIYNGTVVTSEITDMNGAIVFSNLTPGATYTLRETKAPTGYELAADITFVAPARGDKRYMDNPIVIVDEEVEEPPTEEPTTEEPTTEETPTEEPPTTEAPATETPTTETPTTETPTTEAPEPIPPEIVPPAADTPVEATPVEAPKTGDNYKVHNFMTLLFFLSFAALITYIAVFARRKFHKK